jgi:hypothetical protein
VSLSEQTQGVCDAMLIMNRFSDLLCIQNGRKQEISVPASEQMIDDEDLSVQK